MTPPQDIYQAGVRPLLFSILKVDPETLHFHLIHTLTRLQESPNRWIYQQLATRFSAHYPSLDQSLWGLRFANPVGLAAGFDKDGEVAQTWACLGFGFAEVGTVTHQAQTGNPKPRLFRLPQDAAVLNRMGFNSAGAPAVAARLRRYRERLTGAVHPARIAGFPDGTFPLGINLGKSKQTPLAQAAEDYCASFCLLKDWGDYFVVNVSSPNTPGLRSLQDADQLEQILAALQAENPEQKPLLVKIAPDLEWEAIASIVTLAQRHNLAGIIATNTTIRRDHLTTRTLTVTGNPITDEAGGISGRPLRQRSTDVIRFIYETTGGMLPIIGVGGIFTADDAWEKITAGASLVQIYTGWIYEGPWMVRRLLDGLAEKVVAHGYTSIQEAVGTATTTSLSSAS